MKRIAALRGLHLSHTYMCKAHWGGEPAKSSRSVLSLRKVCFGVHAAAFFRLALEADREGARGRQAWRLTSRAIRRWNHWLCMCGQC